MLPAKSVEPLDQTTTLPPFPRAVAFAVMEAPALTQWSDGHLTACHRAAELPATDETTVSHVAPAAARRLALYAERRAAATTSAG